MNHPEILAELQKRGLQPDDLGTHSIRKGAASYVSGGSTCCPSSVSVHLRAGWALSGVQDRYFRYESAGDEYVGRTVCGLPISHAKFAVLPPFFAQVDPFVAACVKTCFPNAPANMYHVLEFCLASVVYHRAFLAKTLHRDHPLLSTPLFRDSHMMNTLAQKIVCRNGIETDRIRATGIPPHVALLAQLDCVWSQVAAIPPAVDSVVPRVVDGVIKVLEDRAIGAGTVTRDGLQGIPPHL
jgi:hypothetical protein